MSAAHAARVLGSNFSYQHHSLERCFDDMAALGRTAFELWGVAPHLHVPDATDDDARVIRRTAAQRGMTMQCFTPEQVAYPVNIASSDVSVRGSSISMFLRAAELCVELGAPLLFLTSGRGREDEPVDGAWARSADALGTIVERAASLGVACVLEPLQRVESNLVVGAAALGRMLDELDSPNLGAVLDTVAMATSGETVADVADAVGDRLRHVHLVDGAPAGHLAWGDGELPLAAILGDLDATGYTGPLTIELFGDGGYALDPLPAVRRSLEAVASAGSAAAV